MPSTVTLNQPTTATWTATDSLSGIQGIASGTIQIDTSSVGAKTATITVQDQAGNTATATKTLTLSMVLADSLTP